MLLNPLGWCPRPSGGFVARETGAPGTHVYNEPTEVSRTHRRCFTSPSKKNYFTALLSTQKWEETVIRLAYVDTEESQPPKGMSKAYKPITYGGKESAEWLRDHLGVKHDGRAEKGNFLRVDVEFDAVEDTIVGCRKHNTENHGRLLAYVHVDGRPLGENLSLTIVRAGRSPYHVKYGRSRL